MNIEIDTNILKEHNLSADDYVYLYIIQRKGHQYLQTLTLKPNLTTMQINGYLELGEHDTLVLTTKGTGLFYSDFDQMFSELLDLYPMKVSSPGRGIRILHAKDPSAKANLKAKKKYKSIVRAKKAKHDSIITSLKTQLEVDKENLGYLQNLETWLNNHTWEKYENIDYDNEQSLSSSPRITRKL